MLFEALIQNGAHKEELAVFRKDEYVHFRCDGNKAGYIDYLFEGKGNTFAVVAVREEEKGIHPFIVATSDLSKEPLHR